MHSITSYSIQYFFLAIGMFLFCTGCDSGEQKAKAEIWYNETKATIFKQSDAPLDSTNTVFTKDNTCKSVIPYSKGHKLLKREFVNDRLRNEVYFSKDDQFEFRREVCENGQASFDGIFYEGKPYGMSTWYYCNGKTKEQGIMLGEERIGTWIKWDEQGKVLEEKNHGSLDKIDQLPVISK
ncbi:hypothetical protein EMGBS15_11200 [Filimonas sp.]|nr:hypothetical protein EMGBS15_11200 [Filimonas sp.]